LPCRHPYLRRVAGPAWPDFVRALAGSDKEALAGLRSVFGDPAGFGPGSSGQRQRGLIVPGADDRLSDGGACGSGWQRQVGVGWGGFGHVERPEPSRCRAACCMMRDALRRFPSSRPLEQPMTDNGDRRGGLELLSASGFRGPHGLGGPVPADSFGEGVEVGFHCLGPFGAVEPGRERRPSGACLFRIHVLVSAPVRAAAVAVGFRPLFDCPVWRGPGSIGRRRKGRRRSWLGFGRPS
jgi:hypothetical protein